MQAARGAAVSIKVTRRRNLCWPAGEPVRDFSIANGEGLRNDLKNISVYIVAGLIIVIGGLARIAIGNVYSEAEATNLIEALTGTGLYLGSAITGASATTLALMLTLLGLTRQADADFDHQVFRSISHVAWLSTISLVGAVILLLMLVLPVGEFEKMPDGWYRIMYEVVFAQTVIVCALLVATVVRLFLAIRHVITRITPGEEV